MLKYFLVGLGGALGSMLRFWLSGLVADRIGQSFPWGTLLVNVSGSAAIGFFATLTGPDGRWLVAPSLRIFFMIGICGGYTTFSSFSLQTLDLMRDKEWFYAGLNIVSSFAGCLIAIWIGHVIASTLNASKAD
jgi:CrcB protein